MALSGLVVGYFVFLSKGYDAAQVQLGSISRNYSGQTLTESCQTATCDNSLHETFKGLDAQYNKVFPTKP